MIVFGLRRFGRCDDLDGEIHVATKFFHVWFVPLVPTETFLVISVDGNSFRGVKLPMSGKSVLAAYFRTSMVGLAAAGIALFPYGLMLTAGAIACFAMSYRWFKPSEARRAELMAHLGVQATPAPPASFHAGAASAAMRDAPPPGPNLVLPPHFDAHRLRTIVEQGAQAVAAPPGAAARWWSGTTSVTLWAQQGSPAVLTFEGPDAEAWKQTLANALGYLGLSDAAAMLEAQDPAQARFGLAVAAIFRDGRLRSSIDRLRMHPDAWVRADAERVVHQMT